MEKIVTLLWKPESQSAQEFADQLRSQVIPRLQELGAEKLKLCVEDDDVSAGAGLHQTPVGKPKSAFVSYWTELAQDRGPIESVLAEASTDLVSLSLIHI